MKVRAIKFGFYGDRKRKVGDVFEISGPSHFSEKWMEKVVPIKRSASKKKPKEESKEIKSSEQEVI